MGFVVSGILYPPPVMPRQSMYPHPPRSPWHRRLACRNPTGNPCQTCTGTLILGKKRPPDWGGLVVWSYAQRHGSTFAWHSRTSPLAHVTGRVAILKANFLALRQWRTPRHWLISWPFKPLAKNFHFPRLRHSGLCGHTWTSCPLALAKASVM